MNTVAEMREVAKRMNLTGTSKLRKSELYAAIVAGIETAHAEALEMNRIRTMIDVHISSEVKLAETRKSFDVRMTNRINGYTIQRNGGKLTPKQLQRIGKKVNVRTAQQARKAG